MTRYTFMANNLFNEFTLHHPEVPLSAIAGQPDIWKIGAAWVLWNEKTSGQNIYVLNWKVTNQLSQKAATPGRLNIQLCSGYTESSMTDNIKVLAKGDSQNADLPAEVVCKTRLESVSGATTTRSISNIPNLNFTRALGLMTSRCTGSMSAGMNTAAIQSCGYGNSSVQTWTLREGEGIAIVPDDIQFNVAYRIEILFSTGTQCYLAAETIRPFATMIPVVLFNGVGSGVVLEILQMNMQHIGTDELCNFAIQKIETVETDYRTDTTSTIVPMDSLHALPSGIKVYEDCLVTLAGYRQGAIMCNPSYRRNIQQWLGTGPGYPTVCKMFGIVSSSEIIDNGVNPIIIRPGEGLALFQKNPSGMGRYGGSILFQTEAIPSTGGPKSWSSVC